MPQTPHRSALRWLFWVQLISMGAMEMSAPFWPLHLQNLGSLSGQTLAWASGLAYAGPMAMAMCFTPWWGRLGDRVGHKPMLVRALVALAITQLWIACTDSVWVLLAVRLVQGALAGFIAAAQAYGASLVDKGQRGKLMASLQVATAVGSLGGPLVGGLVYDALGFNAINTAAAALCALCTAGAIVALPATASKPAATPAMPAPANRGKRLVAWGIAPGLLLGIVGVQMAKMMPQTFFGLFAEQVLHAPGWLIGLCYGATALGLCLAAPWWGRRFDRLSTPAVVGQVQWICGACAAVVAVQALAHGLVAFLLARVLWGVLLAALLPVFYGLLARDAPPEQLGHSLGLGNSAAKAGALLGAGAGSLVMACLPIEYAFWPVALLYAAVALGIGRLWAKPAAPPPRPNSP